MPIMWMCRTECLAPFYGVSYRKRDLVEKLKAHEEKYGKKHYSLPEIVKVRVEIVAPKRAAVGKDAPR